MPQGPAGSRSTGAGWMRTCFLVSISDDAPRRPLTGAMPTGAAHPAGCSANVIFSNPLVEINLSFWGFQNHPAPHYLSQVYHIILGWLTHYFLKTTCLFSGQPPAQHHGCKSGDQFGTQSAGVHKSCTQRLPPGLLASS